MTGRCHPLTANWNGLRGVRDLTSEFYMHNCTIKMHGIRSNRYGLELKKFYTEKCTYVKVLPGNSYQYFRPRGLELKPEGGYKYVFKKCKFKSENSSEAWIVDIDNQNGDSFTKGTIFIHNPEGDFKNNMAPAYMNITETLPN